LHAYISHEVAPYFTIFEIISLAAGVIYLLELRLLSREFFQKMDMLGINYSPYAVARDLSRGFRRHECRGTNELRNVS
jgi:hypothetical protein